MRENGLRAIKATLYRHRPGIRRNVYKIPCRLEGLEITGINQLWVGDVTYIKLRDGSWQYLATIMDRYSRRIVAWSLSETRDGNLTIACLDQAIKNRGCHKGLVFHSDRGVEYLVSHYQDRLRRYGIEQSMSRVREMNDNAYMESFYQQIKTERIKKVTICTASELRGILCEYMRYYNHARSHSSLGYVSPSEFECRMN